jgi:hypothetical protein
MDLLIHTVTEPDHLMWLLGLAALLIGRANRAVTAIFAATGLLIIIGHAVITGA